MIEQLIEKLISEGKVTREEIDSAIQEEKLKSPFVSIEEENNLLRAQVQASDDRSDFLEEVITEIIIAMYPE